jgi:hypothetical protein
MFSWGTYIWTACSAGWFVIAYITQVDVAWIVGIGCILVAYLWDWACNG